MDAVTLSGNDFKTIHNALCELRIVSSLLAEVVNGNISGRLERAVRDLDEGLADAYRQDDAQFDSKMDYYEDFKKHNGLRSIWSIYELPLHGFLQEHPYRGALTLSYQGHAVPILGQTWADLYRAADDVIGRSGDGHHIFIEGFLFAGDELRLTTGS
jgi:hypothetical protein